MFDWGIISKAENYTDYHLNTFGIIPICFNMSRKKIGKNGLAKYETIHIWCFTSFNFTNHTAKIGKVSNFVVISDFKNQMNGFVRSIERD